MTAGRVDGILWGLSLMPAVAVATAVILVRPWVRVCVSALAAASALTTQLIELR